MLREDYDAAKNVLENALDIDATSFEALYNMGKCKIIWCFKIIITSNSFRFRIGIQKDWRL